MNTLTAAHRTLPLPCIVRVTNLQNGRSIVVRVNDRGPFVKDRIIDLSKRGATLLGYIGQGTTKVKVEIMPKESKALKMAMLGQYNPEAEERAEEAKPAHSLYESSEERIEISEKEAEKSAIYASSGGKSVAVGEYDKDKDGSLYAAAYGSAATADGKVVNKSLQEVDSGVVYTPQDTGIYGEAAKNPAKDVKNNKYQYTSGYYIQAGSFTNYELAHKLSVRLKEYGSSHIVEADVNGTKYYRVTMGPYSREEEAKVALAKIKYYGIQGAKIEKK
jgi:rare lipoprotein A